MEAYKVAKIASELSVPILIFKMVSDMANEKSQKVVKDRMTDLKSILSKNIFKVLSVLDIHL
jgi:nucleoside phosphorylase